MRQYVFSVHEAFMRSVCLTVYSMPLSMLISADETGIISAETPDVQTAVLHACSDRKLIKLYQISNYRKVIKGFRSRQRTAWHTSPRDDITAADV
jgi:hypothetical protein